jgi:hypothetical protein
MAGITTFFFQGKQYGGQFINQSLEKASVVTTEICVTGFKVGYFWSINCDQW